MNANPNPSAGLPDVAFDAARIGHRNAMHRLASYVVGPARFEHAGTVGLAPAPSGYATPEHGDPARRVSVEAIDGVVTLTVDVAGEARRTPVTTLAAAAAFIGSEINTEVGAESDSPRVGDVDETLDVDADTLSVLASWWNLGAQALALLAADEASVDPSSATLWPGHFDVAIEVGDENRRASVGASPGDDSSDEPYLYVAAWWPARLQIADDPYWNAVGFTGSRLTYSELAAADDPVAAAAAFYRRGRDLLVAAPDA